MLKGDSTHHPDFRFERTRRVDVDRLLDPPSWALGTNPPFEGGRVPGGEYAKTTFRVVAAPAIDEEDEETLLDPRLLPTTLAGAPTLPGYDLIREIAGGGMSVVYEGIHRGSGCRVAIKHMRESVAHQPELVKRFLAEAVAASKLTHRGAANVFDYGHDDSGVPYLVMEYLEGESLSQRLGRGPLNLAELVAIVEEIATIAHAAHEIGIVHRDLKPDNIFLATGPGPARVMVLDFGVAKFKSSEIHAGITRAGQVLGTPHYMSPEQCVGAEIDARTDVYALGCVMYQMLTGRVPFGGDIVGVIAGHLRDTATAIADLNPDVPAGLIELVESMMSKDAADRPSSMDYIARAIGFAATGAAPQQLSPGESIRSRSEAWRALSGASDTLSTAPDEPLADRPRSRLGLGLLLALVLAAAASSSIWLSLPG